MRRECVETRECEKRIAYIASVRKQSKRVSACVKRYIRYCFIQPFTWILCTLISYYYIYQICTIYLKYIHFIYKNPTICTWVSTTYVIINSCIFRYVTTTTEHHRDYTDYNKLNCPISLTLHTFEEHIVIIENWNYEDFLLSSYVIISIYVLVLISPSWT